MDSARRSGKQVLLFMLVLGLALALGVAGGAALTRPKTLPVPADAAK